ncbi:hypothetical protein [Brevundimonas sp.]|uniref:hypothetical protein n=1 Tax=Brevundimonas sp. TaxID=1871086 RepID=UPI002ABB22AC|nr:hypothetical protein [Brevundimonas sp.]MDZ4364745.1 hypothetical protein [Brevundimonas sp.]
MITVAASALALNACSTMQVESYEAAAVRYGAVYFSIMKTVERDPLMLLDDTYDTDVYVGVNKGSIPICTASNYSGNLLAANITRMEPGEERLLTRQGNGSSGFQGRFFAWPASEDPGCSDRSRLATAGG